MSTTTSIESQLAQLEKAAGDAACSKSNPCGMAAYYDADESKPWRLADDWCTESFSTFEEALASASSWSDE